MSDQNPILISTSFRLKYGDMHHICQFSLCRLQVESRAIGRYGSGYFLCPFLFFQFPLGVLLRVKLGATKRTKFFPLTLLHICSLCCNKVVTTLHHGCYRVNYKAKYKVVTTMFHGCYNLELQPCYNLVAPL